MVAATDHLVRCSHGHVYMYSNARRLWPDDLVPQSHSSFCSVFIVDRRSALLTETVKHANCKQSRVKRCR